MKKLIGLTLFLFSFTLPEFSYAQLARTSWDIGFGWSYPRYVSVNVIPWDGPTNNYGGFISIQRKFSEHVGIRFKGTYSSITGRYGYAKPLRDEVVRTNALYGVADMLFYFAPCEPLSPYLSIGFGGIIYTIENPPQKFHEDTTYIDHKLNIGMGLEWRISEDWRITTDITYHVVPARNFDGDVGGEGQGFPGGGTFVGGGLLGGEYDTWMCADLGLKYYFDKGKPSRLCDLYEGITQAEVPEIDYDRIEQLIMKHIPKEVIKEVVVEKEVPAECEMVLVGVNFDFNKASLRPESFPILNHAVRMLIQNPEMEVEIGGHTDNIGSDQYNQKLSEARAETVREFLISRGIAADRLTTRGYGEKLPITENDTAEGRAMNRRIEFKTNK